MSDKPTFSEILVSQLGKPKEPLGWKDAAFGVLLLLGIGTFSRSNTAW